MRAPWPLHFKHSHGWKKAKPIQVHEEFASHYAWGTNRVSECKVVVKSTWFPHGIKWITYHCHLDCSQKPPLGGRLNTNQGTMALINLITQLNTIFYHVWEPRMNRNSLNSIWLKAQSYITSHYMISEVLHLKHFFWALTISWSCVCESGSWLRMVHRCYSTSPRLRMEWPWSLEFHRLPPKSMNLSTWCIIPWF